MTRLLLPIVAATALSGCHCGTFRHQTGLEWDLPTDDDPPTQLDDYELHEICGSTMGSAGDEDLLSDGLAWIHFDGTHANSHAAQVTSGIFLEVFFPTEQLVPGTLVDIAQASAYVLSNGHRVSGAPFSGGEIEVLDVSDETDDIWDLRDYRVRWDLTWGEEGESEFWYVTSGEDWIGMRLASSDTF